MVKDLPKEHLYLIGVSGGRDSMVLLHLLLAEGFSNVMICHLNHNIRITAERDLDFVTTFAKVSHLNIKYDTLSKEFGSSEDSLRQARMEFFARTSKQTGAYGVFLGHHADDLAETFIWNLLRGSGAGGLGGMTFEMNLNTPAGTVRILRPMLNIWRGEIDRYIKVHSISYLEDETNLSPSYTRNRLRHEIIPWLEKKLERNIRQNLHHTATILQDESRFLDEMVELPDDLSRLSVKWLQEKSVALQRRTILKWLRENKISDVGFAEVESIRSLLDLKFRTARVNLPQNRQVRRRSGTLFLSHQNAV